MKLHFIWIPKGKHVEFSNVQWLSKFAFLVDITKNKTYISECVSGKLRIGKLIQ